MGLFLRHSVETKGPEANICLEPLETNSEYDVVQ